MWAGRRGGKISPLRLPATVSKSVLRQKSRAEPSRLEPYSLPDRAATATLSIDHRFLLLHVVVVGVVNSWFRASTDSSGGESVAKQTSIPTSGSVRRWEGVFVAIGEGALPDPPRRKYFLRSPRSSLSAASDDDSFRITFPLLLRENDAAPFAPLRRCVRSERSREEQ